MTDLVYRDARSMPRAFLDFIATAKHPGGKARTYLPLSRKQLLSTVAVCGIGYLAVPSLAPLFLGAAAAAFALKHGVAYYDRTRKHRGIFYLGSELHNGAPVWLSNDQVRQHSLVLGDTGAGKTEALIAMAENAVRWNSGFLFVDGKADVALGAKLYAMARDHGRQDDLLVLNFLGYKTATFNPLANASPGGIASMLTELLDPMEPHQRSQAHQMLKGLADILVWRHQNMGTPLNLQTVQNSLPFGSLVDLSDPAISPGMPQQVSHTLESYLLAIPGFEKDRGRRQFQSVLDQHGRLEHGLRQTLGMLMDKYGHILAAPDSAFDMTETLLQRRMVLVVLPSSRQGDEAAAAVGKLVFTALKNTMSGILAKSASGSWDDVIERRPTNGISPFLTIFDDVSRYLTDSTALTLAQARSLGIGMIFGAKDIPELKSRSEQAAAAIVANTNTKIFMRMEDEFPPLASTGETAHFQMDVPSAGRGLGVARSSYRPTVKAGEMIVLHHDKVLYVKSAYSRHDLRHTTDISPPRLLDLTASPCVAGEGK